jgi:hypothetical protein
MMQGTDRLRELMPGVIPDRFPEGIELTEWVSTAPDELVESLLSLEVPILQEAARLLAQLGADGAESLSRAESRASSKEARKVLRRAIHQLRSRGVEVRLVRPEGGGRLPAVPVDEGEAFVGPFDADGNRIVLLGVLGRTGMRLFQVLISDERGVVRVEMREGRRSAVRGTIKELRARGQGAIVPVSPTAARELLARALVLGMHGENDGMMALEAELSREPGEGKTPGEIVRERLQVGPIAGAVAAAELRRRVERGDVIPWIFRGEAVEKAVGELDRVEESPLVLAESQKQGLRGEARGQAARLLFDEASRKRLAQRLEETAYLLDARADEEGARAALRVAEEVRSASNPLHVPFLEMLFEFSIELARSRIQEEQKGKLILPP